VEQARVCGANKYRTTTTAMRGERKFPSLLLLQMETMEAMTDKYICCHCLIDEDLRYATKISC